MKNNKISFQKILEIIIFNIFLTIAIHWFFFTIWYGEIFYYSTVSIIIVLTSFIYIYGFIFFHGQGKTTLSYKRLIFVRVLCYIPFIFLSKFNLNSLVDYRAYFSKYHLISDTYYIEQSREDDLYGEYSYETTSSNFKYYIKKDANIKSVKDKNGIGVFSKKSGDKYIVEITSNIPEYQLGESLEIKGNPCLSKEIAYLEGYSSLDTDDENISTLKIIIEFFKNIVLQSGFYTTLCILTMIFIIIYKPKLITKSE